MKDNNGFQKISDFIRKKPLKKAPAYEWQDLALKVIKELDIPNVKRSSVFKACRENPKMFIEQCLNDTKELCTGKEKWRYFFKIANQSNQKEKSIDKYPTPKASS